jgi:hypothetical protein
MLITSPVDTFLQLFTGLEIASNFAFFDTHHDFCKKNLLDVIFQTLKLKAHETL